MRRAERSDKPLVLEILSRSFDENKSVNHVVKQDAFRKDRIKALMSYSFDVCFDYGEIWISNDREGCALVLYTDRKKTTPASIRQDLQLVFKAIGISRTFKVLKRESSIKKNHPEDKFMYLWFVGVNPDAQKKGVGSSILGNIIAMSLKEGRPIYLETSVMRNLPWYKKFGFEVYKELDLGYTLYLLRRPLKPMRQDLAKQVVADSL